VKIECANLAGVNDGSVPLINVVKGLGEYLTSTEDDTRLKGGFNHSNSTDQRAQLSNELDQIHSAVQD
jgi:hypothetical protein